MAHKPSKHSVANKGVHFASHSHVAAISPGAAFIALPSTIEMRLTFLKSLPKTCFNNNGTTKEAQRCLGLCGVRHMKLGIRRSACFDCLASLQVCWDFFDKLL